MITTTAVSPYATYGRPTVTTWPDDAALLRACFGGAMSSPLWKPPHRARNGDVIGPTSGHIASFDPLNAPRPLFDASCDASIAYCASACSSLALRFAVSRFAAERAPTARVWFAAAKARCSSV